ncbi:S8 family peptidase [Deinococcus planocerae]|uniref:S8 family peptidase n=1 Tax=Deinococcus planocerae TaxID=1737569 RepID=UPI000C7F07AE|nr:S8 family serine peptidase [Deinococcus planocerae]
MNKRFFSLLGLTALLAACGTQPTTTTDGAAPSGALMPGQIVVKYRSGLTAASVQPLSNTRVLSATASDGWGRLALVSVPEGQEAAYAERYAGQSGVEYAEPNYRVESPGAESVSLATQSVRTGGLRAAATGFTAGVTDPYFVNSPVDANGKNPFDVTAAQSANGRTAYTNEKYLWSIYRVQAPAAWDAGFTGKGVVVAVIDQGVDLGHPDLAPNLWQNPNPSSTTCPGVNGYDFVDDDADPSDTGGHGTHVSGTIAAAANGQGVVGVAPEAKIMALRGLGYFGGTNYMLARALKYAADCGAQVVNNSWGGSQRTRAFRDVLEYGTAKGVTYVFSAGNSYRDNNRPSWPVSYSTEIPGVIGGGATSNDNRRTAFSSSGNYVTVAAPGGTILSTVPRSQAPNNPYAFLQGTSMAAPNATGVVALIYQARPGITPEQVRQVLTWSANSTITGQNSKPDYPTGGFFGYGIVDAAAAVQYAQESLR